jgi:hypothetical protein
MGCLILGQSIQPLAFLFLYLSFSFFFFFVVGWGSKPRASHILGKHFITDTTPNMGFSKEDDKLSVSDTEEPNWA